MRARHCLAIVLLLPLLNPAMGQEDTLARDGNGIPQTTVGQYGHIQGLVLPGGPWRAKPVTDDRTPLILRVVSTYPHGSDYRYELQYYGLAAGLYDLRDYLESVVPAGGTQLPPIAVEVRSILPAGHITPNPLRSDRSLRLGGYRFVAVSMLVLWFVGLAAILLWRRAQPERVMAGARPPTLAELLRPRLEAARQGSLSAKEYAELERMIIEWWRRRLNFSQLTYGQALSTLREHPSAGPLLRQLERWMHRPGPALEFSLAELLQPYEDDPDGSTDQVKELTPPVATWEPST